MGKSHLSETNRNIELLARLLNGETNHINNKLQIFTMLKRLLYRELLQYYRSLGIEAFGRKSGIIIQNRPRKEDLVALSSYYLSLKLNSDYFSNSIKTYSKIDPRFFSKIILAAKAVTEEIIIKD